MLFYFDGDPGTVIEILETKEHIVDAGMDEHAVGFRTARFGAVNQSPNDRGWDGSY